MNVRKQYSRPNCNLVLAGFDENADSVESEIISILTSAECNFTASNQKLTGGRTFLENLASAVNNYAQGFLSGLVHPQVQQQDYPQIEVTTEEPSRRHRITLKSKPEESAQEQSVTLTTTELFDLVDAIDLLFADRTTLPDVNQDIEVIGKRFRQSEEPLGQRAVPLFTGVLSLAATAGLFFMLPIPEARRPDSILQTAPTETIPANPESETALPTESTSEPETAPEPTNLEITPEESE